MDFLMRKWGGKPVGIWIVALCLLYAVIEAARKAVELLGVAGGIEPISARAEILVAWPILIAAIVALIRRRLMARAFGGMAFALLLYDAVWRLDPVGIVAAPLGFLCLAACRRWFNECLHRVGY